jgi:hypothetical protein
MRPHALAQTPTGPPAASELAQLGAWRRDPHPARTEIDKQDGVILDADDPAEAVFVVCHLVQDDELLGRRSEGRDAEGTCGQERPDSGARMFHHYQYAPFSRFGRLISADSSLLTPARCPASTSAWRGRPGTERWRSGRPRPPEAPPPGASPGGLLTQYLAWRAVFPVDPPLIVIMLALAGRLPGP